MIRANKFLVDSSILILITAILLVMMIGLTTAANEIGFDESFALAEDRSDVLNQLIPGTEDYYYYHCLHYQHTGDFTEVKKLLEQWIKRYNYTKKVQEIRNRQALLEYSHKPEESLKHIKKRMNLQFNHQKQELDKETHHPLSLDQQLISWDSLKNKAFRQYKKNLYGFEDSALEYLANEKLPPDRLRDLLQRLKRPDFPNLPELIVADLKHQYSRGFGSHRIHKQLLLSQLNRCLKLMPKLLDNSSFIQTYLTKLRPGADANPKIDIREKQAYLDRLWDFVKRLAPAHNSLKAYILFRQLEFDLSQGENNKDLFLEYLKLPRNVHYISRDYLKQLHRDNSYADLHKSYSPYCHFPPVVADESLVRSYLERFLVDQDGYDEFTKYIDQNYLKELFAEVKIINGVGDMERWYSLLPPAKYKALKERIDLDFLPGNQQYFGANDPISLSLAVKNVSTLIIKTYELNTSNYYREHKSEILTGIDLDGLVANNEQVINYDEIPLRRHYRTFNFPSITKSGVYLIEFIGNGKSSRALIRKGRLSFTERVGMAGHVFRIHDNDSTPLANASLWLDGHTFDTDEHGEIVVPFTNKNTRQKIIISSEGFAALREFDHQAETYKLDAGLFIDRENLIRGKTCKVLIRPHLSLNGMPVNIDLLENPKLVIESIDHNKISNVKEVKDFVLYTNKESEYELKVPENLSRLTVSLSGSVQNLSKSEKIDLSTSATFTINQIDLTAKVEDLHFRHIAGNYEIHLLGKSGEPKANRAIQLEIKHRHFRGSVFVTVQTDKQGHVRLGKLKDIQGIIAKDSAGTVRTWVPVTDYYSYPRAIHISANSHTAIPLSGSDVQSALRVASLLEVRHGTFVHDFQDNLSIKNGFLNVENLPAGDYDLHIKRSNTHISIRATAGKKNGRYISSDNRYLETYDTEPLQIKTINTNKNKNLITIELVNHTPFTRVHLVATRFMGYNNPFQEFMVPMHPAPLERRLTLPESQYLSGRNIGEEYRYILEHKHGNIYPGNMLKRPSLLLTPWSLQKTQTGQDVAASGEDWQNIPPQASLALAGIASEHDAVATDYPMQRGVANLDFLPETSLVISNLKPDDNGQLEIDMTLFGVRQQLHIIAMDSINTVYREISFDEQSESFDDLRLSRSFASDKHYTERDSISVVHSGDNFEVNDIKTSKVEVYDSLTRVYNLFVTLSNNPDLIEFGFIQNWPTLSHDKKLEYYSKYACHELNFFVFKKDPDFFESAILPFLKNKKDKTFIDHWLIDTDLSPYLESWAFGRLNMVERILLAQRFPDQLLPTSRHVKDLFNMQPLDADRMAYLYKTAIRGSSLDTSDQLGFRKAAERASLDDLQLNSLSKLNAEVMEEYDGEIGHDKYRQKKSILSAITKQKVAKRAPRKSQARMAGDAKGEMRDEDQALMFADNARDMRRRNVVRQFYRKLEKTEEWVENNYYHLPIENQVAELISVNGFWRDYAAHAGDKPFLSENIADASNTFAEMMFALSVLELPFTATEHNTTYKDGQMTFSSTKPVVIYHKEVKPIISSEAKNPILVSQNFFAYDDRYRYENNVRYDKFITEEFQIARTYGCQVALTNPTTSPRMVNLLIQIPRGAIPVLNGFYTRNKAYQLGSFSTQTIEYYFYFPASGTFTHFPAHIAENEKLIAYSKPFTFNVVDKLTKIDKTSWPYVSQHGTRREIIEHLNNHNIERLDQTLIAFRMREVKFFDQVMDLLQKRLVYNDTLWSYGLYHNRPEVIREYLQHASFAEQCGIIIDSPLLTLNPVKRHQYQHKEYWPLVNARVFRLGKKRKILNQQFYNQYSQFLAALRYQPELTHDDLISATYYYILQDRIDDALQTFKKINRNEISTTIQYDYLDAYLAFYAEQPEQAVKIATAYRTYPVIRWRNRFLEILAQVSAVNEGTMSVIDEKDRDQTQAQLAETSPVIDINIKENRIEIAYDNLSSCIINYYPMDIELLFSREPFVKEVSGQFSIIQPNDTESIDLPEDRDSFEVKILDQYLAKNVMIEVKAMGLVKTKTYYPHSMAINMFDNYGQLKVTDADGGAPLSKVYVKVYARYKDQRVRFFKDGYTDLRGRFDYTSLSTDELEHVDKFSLLIMSKSHGAVVREADPPKI